MIDIENLTYRIGNRTLFENATLHLPSLGKIGVVGPNGCGKTTLFRIILEQKDIDAGEIFIKSGARLVCVKQEIENGEIPLLNFIIGADKELIQLRTTLEDKQISDEKLANAYDAYVAIDGYSAEARASSILDGLGFRQGDFHKKLKEFSGGWQVRASLAATLFAPSDCLLLDEPSNHLDLETAMWLENFLGKTNKMILMISHEKQFLNSICNYIVSISNGQLYLFKGNYDTYIDTRSKQETALIKNIEAQQKKREHVQSFIDRFRAKATKAKQAQSRIKMLEKMEIPEMPNVEYRVTLSFPKPHPPVDRKLIILENVAAGYGDKVVLRNVELCVNSNDRIALLGANGNGKSTLAKLLSNRLVPISGKIFYARNSKVSYFSQQQADELNVENSPIEILRNVVRDFSETQARSHLTRFGITQSRSETLIKNLSGGEKSRVLLAINSLYNPHAMVLDEPTNHLDIEARGALIDAINKYEGAVILVTHDFFTLSQTCNKLFIIEGGRCTPFNGTLDSYRKMLLMKEINQNSSANHANETKAPKQTGNGSKLKKRLSFLEKDIKILEAEKTILEEKLSKFQDAETYEIYIKHCDKLAKLENEWLELNT
ncbi:MAG: ABC-F family ATP-binding cassette domain-containing protein [Puniceicoccales bacterium]|jgi:ATP-binding cassette subfamily F protein 3|nr:ABC-F family ATP-binding cassette domain-containing protein [Puniceicoccales bacterium]